MNEVKAFSLLFRFSVTTTLSIVCLSVSQGGDAFTSSDWEKGSKNISKVHQDILGTCSFNAKNYEMNKWLNGLMI